MFAAGEVFEPGSRQTEIRADNPERGRNSFPEEK
jgi:hypothetical protein